MKTLLFVFLFMIDVCFAQFIPYKATITTSKDLVFSSETFTVTYSLTEVEGYVYIGVMEGYFETIGTDRWEGKIKAGETKNVTFTLKLRENSKAGIKEKVPLAVGFSYKPFDKRIFGGEFETVNVTLLDFNELRSKKNEEKLKIDSLNNCDGNPNINLTPQIITVPIKRKDVFKDPEIPNLEYFVNTISDNNNINENLNSFEESEILKRDFNKSIIKANFTMPTEITIQFYAASMSFRNSSNQQLAWQYYTVEIWGLQSPNDQYPAVVSQQIISSSSTGGFTISTTQNYPYYKLAILLEGAIFIALSPPDVWDPNTSTPMGLYGLTTDALARPTVNTQWNINDPDISFGANELSAVLNICIDMFRQGNRFVADNTSDVPGQCLVFYNESCTYSPSFTSQYSTGSSNYPGVYIKFANRNDRHTIMHKLESYF